VTAPSVMDAIVKRGTVKSLVAGAEIMGVGKFGHTPDGTRLDQTLVAQPRLVLRHRRVNRH